jgi:hypothetical protein
MNLSYEYSKGKDDCVDYNRHVTCPPKTGPHVKLE